jgi:hypothetical protein
MRRLYYGWVLVRDIASYCLAHRRVWPLFVIFALAFLVVLVGAAEVAAPYIYTLF